MNTLQYGEVRSQIVTLLQAARATSARSVNALMTASYWEIGHRIVDFEQGGEERAEYGEALIKQLAEDLTRPVWARVRGRQSESDEAILFRMAGAEDFSDTV